jgi:hypothetical protein
MEDNAAFRAFFSLLDGLKTAFGTLHGLHLFKPIILIFFLYRLNRTNWENDKNHEPDIIKKTAPL